MSATSPRAPTVELKGSIFRGYVAWLREHGLFDTVREAVPESVAEHMDHPPLPTEWLVAKDTSLLLCEACGALHGLGTVRRMSREAADRAIFPFFRPLMQGALRRLAGPRGMIRALPRLLTAASRNIEASVELGAEGDEAELVLTSTGVHETPASAEAWAGATETLLQLAGAEPIVRVTAIHPGEPSTMHFRLAWRE